MSAPAPQKLLYSPLESFVEAPFWKTLVSRKLDQGLSEVPLAISGAYKEGDAAMVLGDAAHHPEQAGPSGHVAAPGTLHIFNTRQTFNDSDKPALMAAAAQRIWAAVTSGEAERDPSLLNRFALLCFADLKSWEFRYWFAFPALNLPGVELHRRRLAADGLCASEIAAIALGVAPLAVANGALPACFAARLGRKVRGAEPGEADVAVAPLGRWRELADAAGDDGEVVLCVVDPCASDEHPGWVLRNALCLAAVRWHVRQLTVLLIRGAAGDGFAASSLLLEVDLPEVADANAETPCPKASGWEHYKGKPRSRPVNLKPMMDPKQLAETAVYLNLKLMRWRLMPSLQVEGVAGIRCLLLGAGTLGCQVARSLLGWGVRNITLVDNGRVSFSNPVRQSLFEFKDCVEGGRPKAQAAADALTAIFPGVTARAVEMSIPMPGHAMPDTALDGIRAEVAQLSEMIKSHDVTFLLTDTRESRWLPTMLAAEHGKLAMTVALGFDTFLVMRHGVDRERYADPTTEKDSEVHLGCYFCNDVVAPTDSMSNRTLDQQCTVTRPGLASVSGAMCVELLVQLTHHPLNAAAPGDGESALGKLPHQIRGSLRNFNNLSLTGHAYDRCTGCSLRGERSACDCADVLFAFRIACSILALTSLPQ